MAYNTSKKQILVNFMTNNSDKSLSIDEWINLMNIELNGDNLPVRSTVFRLMQKLVDEKKVIRSAVGKEIKYCISTCCERAEHLHLKCVSCNKITHLSDICSNDFIQELVKNYDFEINISETIIYGKCKQCI